MLLPLGINEKEVLATPVHPQQLRAQVTYLSVVEQSVYVKFYFSLEKMAAEAHKCLKCYENEAVSPIHILK